MVYQVLIWTALFFVHAQNSHLDSRVIYGGKWGSNILVLVLLLYRRSWQYLNNTWQKPLILKRRAWKKNASKTSVLLPRFSLMSLKANDPKCFHFLLKVLLCLKFIAKSTYRLLKRVQKKQCDRNINMTLFAKPRMAAYFDNTPVYFKAFWQPWII